MKISAKAKILIFVGIFAGLTILTAVLLVSPLFEKITKSSAELVLQKKKLMQVQSEIRKLEEAELFYEERSASIEKIDTLFVNAELPIDFISFLEKNALDSKVKIEISPASSQKGSNAVWSSISFQVSISGPFVQCLKFLEKLETGPYLAEVLNLSTSRIGGPASQPGSSSQGTEAPSLMETTMVMLVTVFTR